MALRVVSSYAEAQFLIEVVYQRKLDLLGLNEVESDMTSFLVSERPTQADMEAVVPNGWELVEAHVIVVDWDESEGYDSEESPFYDPDALPGGSDFDTWDLSLEMEDAGAY